MEIKANLKRGLGPLLFLLLMGMVYARDMPGSAQKITETYKIDRVVSSADSAALSYVGQSDEFWLYQPCNGGDRTLIITFSGVDLLGLDVDSATLTLLPYDVDDATSACPDEIDVVYFNSMPAGVLTGGDEIESLNVFDVTDYATSGLNTAIVDIDASGSRCWCLAVYWATLEIELVKPPEIIDIIVSPDNPMTTHEAILDAQISEPAGYEITSISWTGDDMPFVEGSLDEYNPYVYIPPAEKHGLKNAVATIKYRKISGGAEGVATASREFSLFFEKEGDDDSDGTPNWFTYWIRDGAVPRMAPFGYNPTLSYGMFTAPSLLEVGPSAGNIHYPGLITINIFTFGGATGIDSAAEVVEHELYHKLVYDNWNSVWYWEPDPDGDELPNFYEENTSITDIFLADTFDIAAIRHYPDYAFYGDQEYMAMVSGDARTGVASNDWANPGKQASGSAGASFSDVSDVKGAALIESASGNYSDYGTDTNGNSLYDYLTVRMAVNASYSGHYVVVGWLNDTYGNQAALVNNMYYLEAGTSLIELNFNGLAINRHRVNGPYSFSWKLANEDEGIIDIRYNVYNTSAYDYMQFEILPARFTGSFSDYGDDINSNGYYDFLTITGSVNATQPGNYLITGDIYDNNGRLIETASKNNYFGAGNNNFYINFSGRLIYQNGIGGPYKLKYLAIYTGSTKLDVMFNKYNTSFYPYTQFERPPGRLSGYFLENATDSNSNGLYDTLRIRAGVNLTRAGAYHVVAYLFSQNNSYITKSEKTENISADDALNLDFDGMEIFYKLQNGPFDLRYLFVYNTSFSPIISARSIYSTLPYLYQNFEHSQISITGSRDYATDNDGNNLYNTLTLEVDVVATALNWYLLQGVLKDRDGEEIEWVKQSKLIPGNGSDTFVFTFPGYRVHGTETNGPYYLDNIRISWGGNESSNFEPVATKSYNYSYFEFPAIIKGAVLGTDGKPVPNVMVLDSGGDGDSDVTNINGTYKLVFRLQKKHFIRSYPFMNREKAFKLYDGDYMDSAIGKISYYNITLYNSSILQGRVRNTNGAGISNSSLTLDPGAFYFYNFTSGDGSYAISGIPGIDYLLDATPTPQDNLIREEDIPVTVPKESAFNRDIALREGGVLKGTITLLGGAKAEGMWVEASAYEGNIAISTYWAETDNKGEYLIHGMENGTYKVQTHKILGPPAFFSYLDDTAYANIAEKQTTTLDFALEPGGNLTGIIKYSNAPVYNANVVIEGRTNAEDKTDATGRYDLKNIHSGNYKVYIEPPSASANYEIKSRNVNIVNSQLTAANFNVTSCYPSSDVYINQNTSLNKSCFMADSNNNGIFIINKSGIALDCKNKRFSGYGLKMGYGINIQNKNNVTIKNCYFDSYNYGANIYNSNRIRIINSTFSKNNKGIYLYNSAYSQFRKTNLSENVQAAYLYNSKSNNFSQTRFDSGFLPSPTMLQIQYQSENNSFVNNTFLNVYPRIETKYNRFAHNYFRSRDYDMVLPAAASDNRIYGNSFYGAGIENLGYRNDFCSEKNLFGPNAKAPFEALTCDCADNDGDGTYAYSGNCTVGNDCNDYNNRLIGLRDDLYIKHNVTMCQGNYEIRDLHASGVMIVNKSDITVNCNSSYIWGYDNPGFGIYIDIVDRVKILNCSISGFNNAGIYIRNSDNSTIKGVSLADNTGYGVNSISSKSLSVSNSVFKNNSGGILLTNSDNSRVINNSLVSNGEGIGLNPTSNARIYNNIIRLNTYGIGLLGASKNNRIKMNNIEMNYFTGIALDLLSDSNIITENTIGYSQLGGLNIKSNYNRIANNTLMSIDQPELTNYGDINLMAGTVNNTVSNNRFYGSGVIDSGYYNEFCAEPINTYSHFSFIPYNQQKCLCFDRDSDGSYAYNATTCSIGTDCDDSDNSLIGLKDDIYVGRDVRICPGNYSVQDLHGDGLIIINSNKLKVDCSKSLIKANNAGTGIRVNNKGNISIKNCNLVNFSNGIYITNSKNVSIFHTNIVSSSAAKGLLVYLSKNIKLTEGSISNAQYGAYVTGSANFTAEGVSFINNTNGVYTASLTGLRLSDNVFSGGTYGAQLGTSSDFSVVENNKFLNIVFYGIYLSSSKRNSIKNNTVNNSIIIAAPQRGIYIYNGQNDSITNNVIEGRANTPYQQYGIYVSSSRLTSMKYNTIKNNKYRGVYLANSIMNNITDNTIRGSSEAIHLDSNSNFNIIIKNTITNSTRGIHLQTNSINNTIKRNLIFQNFYNIYNDLSQNIVARENWWGTANKTLINKSIYDKYDNSARGIVDFEPWLCSASFNASASPCIAVPLSVNISLGQGWNLISIPLINDNMSVSSIFTKNNITYNKIYSYENNNYILLNENDKINITKGYWINVSDNYNLTVTGNIINNLTFNLNSGYNLISYPSINEYGINYIFNNVNSSVNNILAYNNSNKKWSSYNYNKLNNNLDELNTITTVKPGNAYFVNLNKDANWSFDRRFT